MSYEVYDAAAAPDGEEAAWQVVVEYSNKGEAKPSTLLDVLPQTYGDVEAAEAAALEVARTFSPPDPWSPQGRTVFRESAGFLTQVRGATKTFHFSTRVVRRV
ncbi:hypothetical protein FE634_08555 [Nocardioides dongxiaopingii]|uniref:hypothetical protein n=1 Tax=Nocardioides TaxID=1839 RepID=UPI0010C765E2|nr:MULTISPECIES: hypothetical protein [Nocardioides]QCW50442.1 hypothetical protein FE634_08555 [Nocardioides sp. S-1144]